MKIILHTPNFFSIPLQNITIEKSPVTNRTYFIYRDRIVAVGTMEERSRSPAKPLAKIAEMLRR